MINQIKDNTQYRFESENEFIFIFESTPQSLLLTEFETGKIRNVNSLFCTTFGYNAFDIIGRSSSEVGFWNHNIQLNFIEHITKGTLCEVFEKVLIDGRQNRITVLLYSNIVYIEESKLILTLVVDITIRTHEEKALQVNEEFKAIFYNNAVPIAIFNFDTTIAKVNDAFCRISGFSRDEVIGMSWLKQIPSDELDRLIELNKKWLSNTRKEHTEHDIAFINKQGERKYVHMSNFYLQETNQIVRSFIDTTERTNAEIKLAKQNNEFKELLAAKDKEITLSLLQIANNNQRNEYMSKSFKKLKDQIHFENKTLIQELETIIIQTNIQNQNFNWQSINNHFTITRPLFLARLLKKHPTLTLAEQRLCTLLTLQIRSKEIALITNQEYDSIRVSRTRLRKKLGLENNDNLVVYLSFF
jgi:PAS domain S-box-containing protein